MRPQLISIILFCIIITISCNEESILNPSEKLNNIEILELRISDDDYERLLSNRTNDLEVPANLALKRKNYDVVLEASGAGSRYFPKWSYTVEFEDDTNLSGENEFNLSAQVYDPTMVYTSVASYLYKQQGFEIFNSEHVFVKLNNVDQGLYPMIEKIEEPFFEKRNLEVYQLFKLGFDSKFSFNETNYPEYRFEKKIPDDENFKYLYDFIYARDTSSSVNIYDTFGKHLNIDQYIRYHALTTLINSYDAFTNNFYLYKKSPSEPFEIIPWDFDKIFQPENHSGLAGKNEIITKLFENDSAFFAYKNELRRLLRTTFRSENIFPIIDSTANLIEEAYNLDPYLGNGDRYDFWTEINNLKSYINNRIGYFDNHLDELTKDYFH